MSSPTEMHPNAARWRRPRFLLLFVPTAGGWLALVGWLAWLLYSPVTDWVGRQNGFVQEILGTALSVGVIVLVVSGFALIDHLATGAAGIRPVPPTLPPPGPVPAGTKKWARGRNTTAPSAEHPGEPFRPARTWRSNGVHVKVVRETPSLSTNILPGLKSRRGF